MDCKVNDKPSMAGAKEITVKPISFGNEVALRRQFWVENNRKKVDSLSNGQIAYVYMPNTGREGYTSFNRYYFSQMDKKALLLDERNNGGGSVADYVIDLLSTGIDIWMGEFVTVKASLPLETESLVAKAMIINENAGSGGDMMPYMFRFKGLGQISWPNNNGNLGRYFWLSTIAGRWNGNFT
ncbi:S41 family peptidase [Sphingobacterium daejeonense]|uniref:S41 family peptidase n=1 Tax=Sphingobacterium daejeonense TaxID=371142 RepID=UPI0010C2EEB0|nr:S41 family peptidase [Sphingobacterium daejeonense]VTQ08600.1 Tricorn protease homolog 1 [Sphingobacterium daejeonense]